MIRVIDERNEQHKSMSSTSDEHEGARTSSKLSTKMIKGVSICLVVCYVPYLIWFQIVRIEHWICNEDELSNISTLHVSNNIN